MTSKKIEKKDLGMSETETPRLLTTSEVAKLLRVAESSVRRWCSERLIKVVVTPGGHYRIPESEVLRILRGER